MRSKTSGRGGREEEERGISSVSSSRIAFECRVASRRCPVREADVAAGSNAGEATPGIA